MTAAPVLQPDPTFLADVVAGLSSQPKTLPCKYLYDARGSDLFDQICELEEYYPTRADTEATADNIEAIAAELGPGARLVELGSGSSIKTRILLDHLEQIATYVPVEISPEPLQRSTRRLRAAYPGLVVQPLQADYTEPLTLPDPPAVPTKTVVYFPGSTIGNFHPSEASAFLRRLGTLAAPPATAERGGVLIGVDLDKDPEILERAYDDAAGITAAFNLNLLYRIRRELGAAIEPARFSHRAVYDRERMRIEMHLVSGEAQTIAVGGRQFEMAAGETIRSEVSYKYTLAGFADLAAKAGLDVKHVWTDRAGMFSLQYLVPR